MERNSRAMVAESLRFSSCVLPASAFRLSRSSPAQKALPAPVIMSTCDSDFSASLKARRSSSTSSKLTALRFSGRLNVMVATPPDSESKRVLNDMSVESPNKNNVGEGCRQEVGGSTEPQYVPIPESKLLEQSATEREEQHSEGNNEGGVGKVAGSFVQPPSHISWQPPRPKR